MTFQRVILALVSALVALPGTAHAIPDYPPSGAVVEIEGDVVVGEVIEVRVRNCTLGERVRISIESIPTTESRCDSPIESFAAPPDGSDRRPGVSSHRVRLPDAPGEIDGAAVLMSTDEVVEFVLDVRSRPETTAAVSTSGASSTSGLGGWPYVMLALLIGVGAALVAAMRRRPEQP
jgi:hypothetical protein